MQYFVAPSVRGSLFHNNFFHSCSDAFIIAVKSLWNHGIVFHFILFWVLFPYILDIIHNVLSLSWILVGLIWVTIGRIRHAGHVHVVKMFFVGIVQSSVKAAVMNGFGIFPLKGGQAKKCQKIRENIKKKIRNVY